MPPPAAAELDVLRLCTRPWREWSAYTAAWGRAHLEWLTICCNPEPLRSRWLAALTQMTDRFIRSPAFLDLTRQNLDAMTAFARLAPRARPR